MIKFDKNDIGYIIRQQGDEQIISLVDDSQFVILEINIGNVITFRAVTPLADENNDFKLQISFDNLFAPFLEYLQKNSPIVYDTFHAERRLIISKNIDHYNLHFTKESYKKGDIYYKINKYSRKENVQDLMEQLNLLQSRIVGESFFVQNKSTDSNENYSNTKILGQKVN